MPPKKPDLRVIKTERSIKKVFSELIREKPLEKITVTEIASRAEINKGTFYLHYTDIYALYDAFLADTIDQAANSIDFYADFFDAPESFVRKFSALLLEIPQIGHTPAFDSIQKNRHVPELIVAALKKRLYSCKKIEPSTENDIRLEFILFALSGLILHYGSEQDTSITKIAARNIRNNFSFIE